MKDPLQGSILCIQFMADSFGLKISEVKKNGNDTVIINFTSNSRTAEIECWPKGDSVVTLYSTENEEVSSWEILPHTSELVESIHRIISFLAGK